MLKNKKLIKSVCAGELEKWITFDTVKNTWTCLACGKQTGLRKDNIKRHFTTLHTETPRVQCHICQGLYKNQVTLKQHMRQHMCKYI